MESNRFDSDPIESILDSLGLSCFDDLFWEAPVCVREKLSEALKNDFFPIIRNIKELTRFVASCDDSPIYFGAGSYDRLVPTSVESMASKIDFYTAYKSRRLETLRRILNLLRGYRRAMCQLTGMDSAHPALFCGCSAMAEICRSVVKTTGRRVVFVPATFNPDQLRLLQIYADAGVFELRVISEQNGLVDLRALTDALEKDRENAAVVAIQYPNFYGNLERVAQIVALVKNSGALTIMAVDPVALSILKTPREWGVDIVVGDGAPSVNPISFGKVRLGFIALSKSLLRRLSVDTTAQFIDEDEAFSGRLTFQDRENGTAREEYEVISRSREALDAAVALTYYSRVSLADIKEAALSSYQVAKYARAALKEAGFSFYHEAPFIHEFAVKVDDPRGMNEYLRKWGIAGGIELSGGLLFAFSEKRSSEEVDELVYFMKNYQFGEK